MSTKASGTTSDTRREVAAAAKAAPTIPPQQFARNADWAAAAFRAAGALQLAGSQTSQRVAALYAQAADSARKAGSPLEVVQIQSSLLYSQWQEWALYSQECLLTTSHVLGQPLAGDPADQAASRSPQGTGNGFGDAAMGAVAPMVQAWQKMFAGLMPEGSQARH
jgi:hypothetical protein